MTGGKTLYNKVAEMINRYEAKDVDRDDMYLVMQPEHKEQLFDMIDRIVTNLDKLHGVKIWAAHKTNYAEPYIIHKDTIEEIGRQMFSGGNLDDA